MLTRMHAESMTPSKTNCGWSLHIMSRFHKGVGRENGTVLYLQFREKTREENLMA